MKTKILISTLTIILACNFIFSQEKNIIKKAEDLPKHSYSLEMRNASEIVKDKEQILEISKRVQSDLLSDLEKNDIQDKASLKDYYRTLSMISVIQEDYLSALNYIENQKDLAEKESEKIINGIQMIALLKSAMKLNTFEPEKLSEDILHYFQEAIDANNFPIIQEEIEELKGYTEFVNENIIWGNLQTHVQTAIDNNKGDIPSDLIVSILGSYFSINYYVPYLSIYNKAFETAINKYSSDVEKINIWNERDISLEEANNYSEVIIAVWDTGVDTEIFKNGSLWINKNEFYDNIDNDKNGFIDDVHGIAYDIENNKTTPYLEQKAHNHPDLKELQKKLKGLMDIYANINSEDAKIMKKYFSTLKPEQFSNAIEDLNLYGIYAHGTHVAGISIKGNPFAQLMVARMTFSNKNIPPPITKLSANKNAKLYKETIAYFKKNNAQIVNMSWSWSYEEILDNLEKNGIGENDDQRKKLAKEYFEIQYKGFRKAIESAPEILFICSAGNSNDDVDFTGTYPSSLNLSNLICVGAVDIEGKKTNFTTEGKSVDVYANGYEVLSYVPGGDQVALSGTSMASPMVVNLAGKLLAINPKLTPKEIKEIIVKTATKTDGDENILLIHPKKAVDSVLKK